MFKTALEYRDRITFGHEKIDRILDLHFGAMFRIFGETRYSNALVTRLGLGLPRNHGGINAENVIVIDAEPSLHGLNFGIQYFNTALVISILNTDWQIS